MIIFGTRMFGKCDQVGNLFYIRTRFFHVWFIPLIPVQSYIVLAGSEDFSGFKGIPTSMSLKSVLFGWLRGGLTIAAIAGIFLATLAGFAYAENHDADHLIDLVFFAVVAAGSIFLYWLSVRFAKASYQRALELADQLGVSHELIEEVYAVGSVAEAYR